MKPSPINTTVAALLTGAVAALAGWSAVGWWSRTEEPSAQPAGKKAGASVIAKSPAGPAYAEVLRRLAEQGLPQGLSMEAVLARSPAGSRYAALDDAMEECLLRELVEHDPQAALAAAAKGAGGRPAWQLVDRVLACWLRLDVNAALAAVDTLPATLKDNLQYSFGIEIAKVDPQRALDLAKSGNAPWINRVYGVRGMVEAAVKELGRTDPEAALSAASGFQKESGPSAYGETIRPVLKEWAERDPAAVRRWIAEHGDDGLGAAGVAGAVGVFATDPVEGARMLKEAIARHAELNGDKNMNKYRWQEMAGSITKGNAEGALSYARSLPKDDPLRAALLEAAAAEGMDDKTVTPEALALLAEGAEANPSRPDKNYEHWKLSRAINEAMQQLAAADPKDALEKARAFPDASQATAAVLGWVMQNNPEGAPALLKEALSSPESTAAIVKVLSGDGSGVAEQPADYSGLLAKVPEARALIAGPMLANWVVANPAAASDFLAEEIRAGRSPAGSQRMVVQWALNNTEAAAAWVETLPAGEFRKTAEENLINTWQRTDPEAAGAWQARVVKPKEGKGKKR
jgi:hypothetical protein